ncbi:hypothetical protein [Dishui Lake phycodnavirus 3]|nr:hypothetical protein [Dishui Lake phycodnavirus 3]
MKQKTVLLVSVAALILAVMAFLTSRRPVVIVRPPQPPAIVQRRPVSTRAPEFREAPIKKYKPGHTQQMGLLLGDNNETLPLYGREVRGHRDRYHYYTTSDGYNLYPLTVSHNGRECTEDIGCPEFYGNERVAVLSKTGTYATKLYRTDDFFA